MKNKYTMKDFETVVSENLQEFKDKFGLGGVSKPFKCEKNPTPLWVRIIMYPYVCWYEWSEKKKERK